MRRVSDLSFDDNILSQPKKVQKVVNFSPKKNLYIEKVVTLFAIFECLEDSKFVIISVQLWVEYAE